MELVVSVTGRPDAIRLAASTLLLNCPLIGEGHTHDFTVRQGHHDLQTTREARECLQALPSLVGQLTYGLAE